MVKGWEKALRTMTVGERAIIRVTDPELGYGAVGVPPFVPPNAQLEFDIEVLDAQLPNMNIDFDSLANADNTPVSKIQCIAESSWSRVPRISFISISWYELCYDTEDCFRHPSGL